jgi:hypothetical protein
MNLNFANKTRSPTSGFNKLMCVQHQCYFGVNKNLKARNAVSAHESLNLVSLDAKDSAVTKSTDLSKTRLDPSISFLYFLSKCQKIHWKRKRALYM